MAATLLSASSAVGRMRPLNVLRDLPAVADLIELCFSSTLDSDGRSYIDQMRRSGRDTGFLAWAPRVIETVSLPLSGFVWEDKGRVVGNVSLIPFSRTGQKIFLIANVATHPDFRRQGIARQLTEAAMKRAREKRADALWLHVRDDNPGAIQLYKDLGFVERARRTTWLSSGMTYTSSQQSNIEIVSRSGRDWTAQREWLARSYPNELDWYQSNHWNVLEPGIFNALYRFMADIHTTQWSAFRNGRLQGVLGSQYSPGHSPHLWVALPPHSDGEVVTLLLRHGCQTLMRSQDLALDYPAGQMDDAIRDAGFLPQRTLAWMEAPGVATFRSDQRNI